MRGNRKRFRRAYKSREGIRTMQRPAGYDAYGFCVVLIPEQSHPRAQSTPPRHAEMIAAVRRSGRNYRIATECKRMTQFTRIYIEDETGLFFLKLIDASLIWKTFRLTNIFEIGAPVPV